MSQKATAAFGIKGFCDSCGVYKRSGLTFANYADALGRMYRKAQLCSDCYAELADDCDDLEQEADRPEESQVRSSDNKEF